MATNLIERLIAHLHFCPCCRCEAHTVSTPEDGIPDGYVHESAFQCGARILVSDVGDFSVSTGCPYPADDKLQDYRQKLIGAEEEQDEEDDQP